MIPKIDEINDMHKLTGSALRTRNPLFHCFDMADSNDLKVSELAPHRAGFYTLAFSFGTEQLRYTLNENDFAYPSNFLLCVAPGQVVTWKKRGDWFGYCTFFKSEFLQFAAQLNFLQQYPFFNFSESNLLPLEAESFVSTKLLFEQILREQAQEAPFSEEIIKAHFQAILWKVRRIYEAQVEHKPRKRAGAVLTAQFQYLLNEHFLQKNRVEEYAALLNVSANYLSQTVKAVTGSTAKSLISQRRIEEAKFLLRYTTRNIAEIAFHLGFSEATHFSKLFKKLTGMTPQTFRDTSFSTGN